MNRTYLLGCQSSFYNALGKKARIKFLGSLLAASVFFALPVAAFAAEQGPQVWRDGQEHRFDGDTFRDDGSRMPILRIHGEGTKFIGNNVTIDNRSTDNSYSSGMEVSNGSFELSGKSTITVKSGQAVEMWGPSASGVINGGTTINLLGNTAVGLHVHNQARLELNGAAGNEIVINFEKDLSSPRTTGIEIADRGEVEGRYIRLIGSGTMRNKGVGIAASRNSRVRLDYVTISGITSGVDSNTDSHVELSNVVMDNVDYAVNNAGGQTTIKNGAIRANERGFMMRAGGIVNAHNVRLVSKGKIADIGWMHLGEGNELNVADGSSLVGETGIEFTTAGGDFTLSGASTAEAKNGYAVSAIITSGTVKVDQNSVLTGSEGLYKSDNSDLVMIADNGSKLYGRGTVTGPIGTADITLRNGSSWVIDGNSNATSIVNDNSTIAFSENKFEGDQNGFTSLRVAKDYTGRDSTIIFNAALNTGNADSPHDHLLIEGDAYGTTHVEIRSRGGLGSLTDEDGINLITVNGVAENGAGTFTGGDYRFNGVDVLAGGAYVYTLKHREVNGIDEWNLHSVYEEDIGPVDPSNPGGKPVYNASVPLYEAYPQILRQLNRLPTLQQRVGNRVYMAGETKPIDGLGFWMQVEGSTGHFNSAHSLTGANYDLDAVKTRMGVDFEVMENNNGVVIGGVYSQYGYGRADVSSRYGFGKIKTDAYGAGGTLTWYGNNGFYVDAQAQVQWFDSSIYSRSDNGEKGFDRYLTTGNHGLGYGFSVEGGRRIALSDGWSVTPQAQLVYSHVDFNSFSDSIGVRMTARDGGSLLGRAGAGVEHERNWTSDKGDTRSLKVHGTGDIYHEFLDGSSVSVSGVAFRNRDYRTWAGIGGGVDYSWKNGKYAVYGDVNTRTAFEDFGKSYQVQGTVGFKVKF
ncbi:MAG: Outer membrane autotransporter [Candidatus Tokpelaia hoelldobleri]|uniref:Outer membrane autotransporter n=1 Tax=Candidatus Tokpelaia hoelldobleri TaxID=1902579 RepID=A0A1U9JT86_9HYPH|nr:MAG: Outer membrane autotransporter [Candidatus Tokpelaia hoelldoblerii]